MTDSTAGWLKSLLPFLVICFGGFMTLLDIQIVASSLQYIGGGLSAAQDGISWVQTAYLIAEIIVIHAEQSDHDPLHPAYSPLHTEDARVWHRIDGSRRAVEEEC